MSNIINKEYSDEEVVGIWHQNFIPTEVEMNLEIPKAGMCMSCTKCFDDCSNIKFEGMQYIGNDEFGYVVKCSEFEKDVDNNTTDQ